MRKIILVAASCIAITAAVFSQTANAQSAMVDGRVTRIDQAAGKITLRHGPIKNLDMEAMSMVFRVQDPAMLKGVKVGDKVRFEADRVNGQITITKMQRAK